MRWPALCLLLLSVDLARCELEADLTRSRLELKTLQLEIDKRLGAVEERVTGRRLQGSSLEDRLLETVHALQKKDDTMAAAADNLWLLLCGAILMFMHVGFAMVECGTCRARNASDALIKNMLSLCVGTLGWWSFGWGFATGSLFQGFIGTSGFFGSDLLKVGSGQSLKATISCDDGVCPTKMAVWFFNWGFCTTACTIVSGAVLERAKSSSYSVYTFFMTAFVYPVIVAWTWSDGWLASLFDVGYTDFAGSCIVHVSGGMGALVGTVLLGPRLHRFHPAHAVAFEPHNLPFLVLGTLFLWVGWFAFNAGSTLSLHTRETATLAAQVAVNTALAGSSGGTSVFFLRLVVKKKYDLAGLCNGILAGVVSVTAGCANMNAGSALAAAVVGGLVFEAFSALLKRMHIDDPVDASAVHLACGIWGTIAATLFDWGKGFEYYHGQYGWTCLPAAPSNDLQPPCIAGIVGTALAAQVVLILCVLVWIGFWSFVVIKLLTVAAGLRVKEGTEQAGLDAADYAHKNAYALEERESPDSWRVLSS